MTDSLLPEVDVQDESAPEYDSRAKSVIVVVPAFNEAQSIVEVVSQIRASYPQVVVVDDGSSDETGELAQKAGAVRLRHVINRGQGAALQTGIEYALSRNAEVVITFDADGQHSVDDIRRLCEPIFSGEVDVALGSRFLTSASEIPRLRKLLLSLAVLFTRATSGAQLTDTHNGLRAFSRTAASKVRIRLDGMAHASEIIETVHRSGLRYCEVPVRIRYTPYSIAKGQRGSAAFRIVFDYFMDKVL